jgi:hypothetical protein
MEDAIGPVSVFGEKIGSGKFDPIGIISTMNPSKSRM